MTSCLRWMTCLLLASSILARDAARAATPPRPGYAPVFQREDSLTAGLQWDAARALMDSVYRDARARRDSTMMLEAGLRRGWRLAWNGRLKEGEPDLLRAAELAPVLRDTLRWCWALRALTNDYLQVGRIREAKPKLHRWRQLATACRDTLELSRAQNALAYLYMLEGQYPRAREVSRRVLEYEQTHDPWWALGTRLSLGTADAYLGEPDAARMEFQSVIRDDSAFTNRVHTAGALGSLGRLEFDDGDPGAAVQYWQRALELLLKGNKVNGVSATRLAMSQALAALGQLEQAAAQCTAAVEIARRNGDREQMLQGLVGLSEVRCDQGRFEEALALSQDVLGSGDEMWQWTRLRAELTQVAVLEARGRPAEALDQLRGIPSRAGRKIEAAYQPWLSRREIELLIRSGHHREALRRSQLAIRASDASWPWYRHYLRARCYRILGERDSAVAELSAATSGWERWRVRPSDPEWRETRGALARHLYSELGSLILQASPNFTSDRIARRGFDALQVFKARTLEERMRGLSAAHTPSPRATLTWLQGGGLHPGELFLDFYCGDDSLFVFAVSSTAFRAVALHGSAGLQDRTGRALDLFALGHRGRRGTEACETAARALGTMILGNVADLVLHSRRLLVSADGALTGLPFGALALDGGPLLQTCEVVTVPSASVLMQLRTRASVTSRGHLLALARSSDAEGRPYTGVDREAHWLQEHLTGVTVRTRVPEGSRRALLDELPRCDALHIAAHTEINAEAPWRSGILLAGTGRAQEQDYLRAATVAGMKLHARLAVLSGCQSFMSRTAFGEGVLGLSTAFLSAGVPVLVSTLWSVDDEATASFMEEFYRGLSGGASPSAALRSAQLALRSRTATRHPFYWAGFVLVGDPEARVGLRRRPGLVGRL